MMMMMTLTLSHPGPMHCGAEQLQYGTGTTGTLAEGRVLWNCALRR